ncbi:hypothetical protein DRN77_06725 [Methanosarcinales archaeon]|nr:MAG: hypothetical protein DRN77_06725 [Methanosarcinales archaeon]
MKRIEMILIILLVVAACGCIVPEEPAVPTPTPTGTPAVPQSLADMIPRDNLPGAFKLIAVIDKDTPGTLNITEEAMSLISGNLNTGEIQAVRGIYSFEGGNIYATIIKCTDSVNAANAVENYKNQPTFEMPPSKTVNRFGNVHFNGHEATEIRMRPLGTDDIRYGYVWSNGDLVFIVEPGPKADDKQANMKLAMMLEQ